MKPMKRRFGGVALLLALTACGGGGGGSTPTTPSTPVPPAPTPTPTPPITAGTVLTLVSGETDQPVGGATVSVGGRTLSTDAAGRVALPETVNPGTALDLTAAAFLDRLTLLRSPASTRFTLWPRTSPTGLTETYTATLVYTSGASGTTGSVGADPLERITPGVQPFLVPSAQILSDPPALAAHQDAVNAIAAATGGQLVYQIASQRPGSGAIFETRIDPAHGACEGGTIAATFAIVRNGEIVGGSIIFCRLDVARNETVTHEVGHTFGLNHSPDSREVMNAQTAPNQNTTLSAREALCMRLMLQRPAGNRFPDNERAIGLARTRERVFLCY